MERIIEGGAGWLHRMANVINEALPGDVIIVNGEDRQELAERALERLNKIDDVKVEVRYKDQR